MSSQQSRRAGSRKPQATPRAVAWRALVRLLAELTPVDQLLNQVFTQSNKALSRRERAQVTNLVSGCLKYRRRLDWLIARLAHRRQKIDHPTRALLQLALFELAGNDGSPPYAVVSEAVNLARKVIPGRESFVNGLLRSFLRRGLEELLPSPTDDLRAYLGVYYSLPDWLVDLWLRDYGAETAARLCRQANDFTGTTFRINQLRTGRDDLLRHLAAENLPACSPTRFSPCGCTAAQAGELIASDFFRRGLFTVQDEGAQLIGYLLDPRPGQRILDACAAPGGKTGHLAELSRDQATIIAVDSQPKRLRLVAENAARLGLRSIRPLAADLRQPVPELEPRTFDAVLVDAPCSGLGVLRRRPDLRWQKKAADPEELATIQLQILANCSRYLKTGGRLVYATCTSSKRENQGVVREFLRQHPDFYPQPPGEATPGWLRPLLDAEGCLQTFLIDNGRMDGFFAAVFSRR